jgi:hypothetical protein
LRGSEVVVDDVGEVGFAVRGVEVDLRAGFVELQGQDGRWSVGEAVVGTGLAGTGGGGVGDDDGGGVGGGRSAG